MFDGRKRRRWWWLGLVWARLLERKAAAGVEKEEVERLSYLARNLLPWMIERAAAAPNERESSA